MIQMICQSCGTSFQTYPSEQLKGWGKFCSRRCRGLATRTFKYADYEGQAVTRDSKSGYLKVSTKEGKKFLHLLIVERLTGVKLFKTPHIVHHVDGDKLNNSPDNLVILENQQEHMRLHQRKRIQDRGGDWRVQKICSSCKTLLMHSHFPKNKSAPDGLHAVCKECLRRERERAHYD